mmetsp:Transcript_24184/g.76007  ORF Transcript_24184/g.76007 Transcript_24184/m.76007 type:complete len:247 (+) Transcript_24184:590-1330(+)
MPPRAPHVKCKHLVPSAFAQASGSAHNRPPPDISAAQESHRRGRGRARGKRGQGRTGLKVAVRDFPAGNGPREPARVEAHGPELLQRGAGPPRGVGDDQDLLPRGMKLAHGLNGAGVGHPPVVEDAKLVEEPALGGEAGGCRQGLQQAGGESKHPHPQATPTGTRGAVHVLAPGSAPLRPPLHPRPLPAHPRPRHCCDPSTAPPLDGGSQAPSPSHGGLHDGGCLLGQGVWWQPCSRGPPQGRVPG